jgi:DNA-binding transcriptional ArsR family regulator
MTATGRSRAVVTRREILRLLRERDMNAGEIASHFEMSKPSISHHLGVLKQANMQDLMARLLRMLGANNEQDG